MNLLYISSEYPPETGYGGIGTYTKHISEGMAARGHSVSVICRSDSGLESVSEINGVTVHRIVPLPYPLPANKILYPLRRFCISTFPHSLNRLSWAMAVGRRVRRLFYEYNKRFDIIESPECGAESLFVPDRICKKRIVRLHTPWEMIRALDKLMEPWGDRLLLPFLERFVAKCADAVSAPSLAIAEHLKRQWRISNITVIPNPLPLQPFSPPEKEEWIYTGRIERRKGVHILINSYAKAASKCKSIPQLKLIGRAYGKDPSGIDYGTLIGNMINNLGVSSKTTWIKNVSPEEIPSYLSNASVAFFPSLWENFPYTCLEAMSRGCAVVASNCGGFPEIIRHNESGLLVDADSEQALESAMLMLIDNPELISRLGRAARRRVEELAAADRICREMEFFYRQ